jgi:hypothetical protein
MKSEAVFLLSICTSYLSYASENSQSSSSSDILRLNPTVQIAQEAEELLKTSLDGTAHVKKCLKNLKVTVKESSSKEKELLIPLLNGLRVKWAQILLAKLVGGSKQSFDELVECILHMESMLNEDLKAMQQAWVNKHTFGRAGESVERTLEHRQREIDSLKEEEKKWKERISLVDKEIKDSQEPLTEELMVPDNQKHPEFIKMVACLQQIDDNISYCKEIARKTVISYENDNDDESSDDTQKDDPAIKSRAIEEHFEQIRNELRKSILSTLDRRPGEVNVDHVTKEFTSLVAALPDTISAAHNATRKYLETLERIKENRRAYREYNLHASIKSGIEHSLAHVDHEQHRLLIARLKLFVLAEQSGIALKSTPLHAHELTLLENNKAVLSKKEKAALAKKNGGLFSRFFI